MEDVEKKEHGLNLVEKIEEAKASYESTENWKECEELFTFADVLIRNTGAIQQFKDGIKSISPILIPKESFGVMKTFSLVTNERISLEEFIGL